MPEHSSNHLSGETDTDWKAIAIALAERVVFAINHFQIQGSGLIWRGKEGKAEPWQEWFADGVEMIPGVTIDREIAAANRIQNKRERKKEFARIEAERKAKEPNA